MNLALIVLTLCIAAQVITGLCVAALIKRRHARQIRLANTQAAHAVRLANQGQAEAIREAEIARHNAAQAIEKMALDHAEELRTASRDQPDYYEEVAALRAKVKQLEHDLIQSNRPQLVSKDALSESDCQLISDAATMLQAYSNSLYTAKHFKRSREAKNLSIRAYRLAGNTESYRQAQQVPAA